MMFWVEILRDRKLYNQFILHIYAISPNNLAMQEARASAVIGLTQFTRAYPISALLQILSKN